VDTSVAGNFTSSLSLALRSIRNLLFLVNVQVQRMYV